MSLWNYIPLAVGVIIGIALGKVLNKHAKVMRRLAPDAFRARRLRMWQETARTGLPTTLVETYPRNTWLGWVYISVRPVDPVRGRRPVECHHESLGWAWTRWGANRKLRRINATTTP